GQVLQSVGGQRTVVKRQVPQLLQALQVHKPRVGNARAVEGQYLQVLVSLQVLKARVRELFSIQLQKTQILERLNMRQCLIRGPSEILANVDRFQRRNLAANFERSVGNIGERQKQPLKFRELS